MAAFLLAVVVLAPVAVAMWGLAQIRRGRAAVIAALEQEGYAIIRLHYRWVRQGPFFWTTTRSQLVYRGQVRDARGVERVVWARWGRPWLFKPVALELRWEK